MILQLSNYCYDEHLAEHTLNMAFWRAVRQRFGPLHVVGRSPVAKVETTEVGGIFFTAFPRSTGPLGYIRALRRWLASQPVPRLLWCSDASVTPLVAKSFAQRHRVPLLVELQRGFSRPSYDRPVKDWLARNLAVRAARRADFVRVCAQAHAHYLINAGVPAHRICVIPARVDVMLFDPDRYDQRSARERIGIPSDAGVVVVGVGNLVSGKGFHHAIEALLALPVDTRLILVGDGPEQSELRSFAQKLGVGERLLLLGRQQHGEIPRILAAADIFVLPSYSEGMPRAVSEAQAMKLPVVATAIDGIVEQVIEGESGFLCPPGNSDALANALRKLVNDSELRSRFGSQGRVHVINNFSFERIMKLWGQLLVRFVTG